MSEQDSPWKEALERYLPSFLALYFPTRPRRNRLDARV